MALSISRLYDEYAETYSVIAHDRDFAAENSQIYRLARSCGGPKQDSTDLLELFAGPAWHSAHWRKTYGGRVIAVDSSISMRQLAVRSTYVAPDDYLIARLPALPSWPVDLGSVPCFTVVLALRYSIGYLNPLELGALLERIRTAMAPGGALVIELHRPELLAADFASLEIRTRSASLGDGATVTCAWPSGPIDWTSDRLVATMPVQFVVHPPRAAAEYLDFVSTEYIYQPAHIEQACYSAGGGFSIEDWTTEIGDAFHSSIVLALRRQ